jgi:O-antigen biosynthesis protein
VPNVNRVCVIVPAYNAEATIAACVESLLAQSRKPDEIVVVDDCSTDRTAEIALGYAVTVLRLAANVGPGLARNAGAAAASAELLAFTDSDCVAPPTWLQSMIEAMEQSAVAAVTGGYAGPTHTGFLTDLQHALLRARQASLPTRIASTITSNLVCSAEVFRRVGGFPIYYRRWGATKPVWGNEDEELGFLIARAPAEIRWVPDVGVKHRFRLTLAGYLAQQRFYAERIVMSHVRFPGLAGERSNYSRWSGALHLLASLGAVGGVALALGALAGLPIPAMLAIALLGLTLPPFLLLPLRALRDLSRQGFGVRSLAKAYGVLLLVDLAWLSGAVKGTLVSLGGFVDAPRSAGAPSPADRAEAGAAAPLDLLRHCPMQRRL